MSNIYEIVTDKIVKQLDKGIVPWNKPWTCSTGAVSHYNGRPYSLLNQIMLMDEDDSITDLKGREYITFTQIKAEGGSIRKGEKSKMVVFWKMYDKETNELDANGNKVVKRVATLRYYNVWEVGQCEGIKRKYEAVERHHDPIAEAEAIVSGYFGRETCTLEVVESDRAFYSPILDLVHVPQPSQYEDIAEYYSTLFHEMTHSTWHKSRCDRELTGMAAFGGKEYSREELVAEMGAAFLMNTSGIDSKKAFRNSVGYIQGWSRKLRDEPRMFVTAAGKAEKAVEYIINGKEDVCM